MIALLLDTETTGLIENRTRKLDILPEIVEFYGCRANLQTGEIEEELELLIKPTKYPRSEKVMLETKSKISDQMLVQAPLFQDVAQSIVDFIERAPLVITHNAAFDRDMIEIELERLQRRIVWPPVLCTIEQTMHLHGYRLSLTNLHVELFGQDFPEAHRAKQDVMALLRCCIKLHERGDI